MIFIARRQFRIILMVCLACIFLFVGLVYIAGEDLENTLVNLSYETDMHYIIKKHTKHGFYQYEAPYQKVFFIPSDTLEPIPPVPEVFSRFVPGKNNEVVIAGETFIGKLVELDNGHLYFAKNITLFEQRERLFHRLLFASAILILIFGALLAYVSTRRLVKPLHRLTQDINNVPIGKNMPQIDEHYEEVELHAIANNFNQFILALNQFVQRENNMLSMASHELRTPLAVISGALDIMESRNQLSDKDKITLQRIRSSTLEMRSNVETLLMLSRQENHSFNCEIFDLRELLNKILVDLNYTVSALTRVSVHAVQEVQLLADPLMVTMLLRNLIQNALQHTKGTIQINIEDKRIDILDQGAGLGLPQKQILAGKRLPENGLGGLGLYIVTLMAERLQWSLSTIDQDSSSGVSGIRLDTSASVSHSSVSD